jgi:aspartate--ammonia ligase
LLSERYPELEPFLPKDIHYIHAEELRLLYPNLTPKERENMITKEYGAVFIRGIGGKLGDGTIHDNRSPDYDDWSTQTPDNLTGLNGDIIIWNPVLQSSFELSSMGIRVDAEALHKQLIIRNATDRENLFFHKLLLEGKLPQTMGGGIGQSRLCMLLLRKCHIGEVQSSVWSEDMLKECEKKKVFIF